MQQSKPRQISLLLALCILLASATQTTVVSETLTTTIHATATDNSNACNNFVGACVVYGNGQDAPYTTTVYASRSQHTITTTQSSLATVTTKTEVATTTTVSDGSGCESFSGACVVYATTGAPQHTTTARGGGAAAATTSAGDSDGYIAQDGNKPNGQGQLGGQIWDNVAPVNVWRPALAFGLGVFALAMSV